MRQKAKMNSEGRKLCNKNSNKYILEKEDNNGKKWKIFNNRSP